MKTAIGFSEAAEILNHAREVEAVRCEETVFFSNFPLHDQLIDVFTACSSAGWEGEDSVAVRSSTLILAKELIESLPKKFRTPGISGEPDGHVALEWYVNPRRILTVSICPDRRLHWAALIGAEDPRGSCVFYGEAPKTLLYWIGRICER